MPLDIISNGLFGLAGAIIGAFASWLLTLSRYKLEGTKLRLDIKMTELEIKRLGLVISEHSLEREKDKLEYEKLKYEIAILRQQEEKHISEISVLRQQELRLLKDEFWNKFDAKLGGLTQDRREFRGLILKEAFLSLRKSSEDQDTKFESVFESIAIRYEGRNLSNAELIRALADIERCKEEIDTQEQLVHTQYHALGELPYDEREKARVPVEQEREKLRNLFRRLIALRGKILRSSLVPGMTLPNVDLEWVDLPGMDLSSVRLFAANLHGANLPLANFGYANLEDTNLTLAKMGGSNLRGARLRRARLNDTDLRDANLEGADLSGADLTETDFTGANLCDAIFIGAKYCKEKKYTKDTKWPDGFDPQAAGALLEE